MALIVWKDKFKVGIWLMDTQHKRWIELINDLYEAMRVGKGRDVVGRTLAEMLNYARRHFADEEALMSTHGWPEYSQHKKEHEVFVAEVAVLQQRQQAGELAVSIKVMTQMQNWLVNHILTVDRRSVPFLKKKGVR